MGLAASQVRLLQLTSRQHRIEYQAQKIQAQKLQLSNESDASYNKYMAALDATKVQYKHIESDGSISYIDATFDNMFSKYNCGVQGQYALEIMQGENQGKFFVSDAIKNIVDSFKLNNETLSNLTVSDFEEQYKNYTGTTVEEQRANFIKDKLGIEGTTQATDEELFRKWVGIEFAKKFGATTEDETAYYQRLGELLAGREVVVFNSKYGADYEWLTNMINNGSVQLHKYEIDSGILTAGISDTADINQEGWAAVAVATDLMLQEVSDEKELKKAEATYEAETARINKKDAQYDTLLSQTETERSAIKTEMDSLKQVRSDNIERAFKLFS